MTSYSPEAKYFPVAKTFKVEPGLRPLGFDFGNKELDAKLFQIDKQFPNFRENKLRARAEKLSKYYGLHQWSKENARHLHSFLVDKFIHDNPKHFKLEQKAKQKILHCHLSDERIIFSNEYEYLGFERDRVLKIVPYGSDSEVAIGDYESGFDALANQVPEDLAVMQMDGSKNWLAAIHLCSPSHWAAADKIGKDFAAIHLPVPEIEKINGAADHFVQAMIFKGPFTRFTWSVTSDDRLNHNPYPPPGFTKQEWHERNYENSGSFRVFLRVERQATWGFPSHNYALFTIRIYHWLPEELLSDRVKRFQLSAAIASMSPELRSYKGLAHDYERVQSWLQS